MSDLSIVKIFDYDCPICEFMSTFDKKVLFDLNVQSNVIPLDSLLNAAPEDSKKQYIARLVEVYACNADYTLDLPVYLVTSGKTYLGHVVGEHTQHELKTKLERILNGAQDTQSQGNLDA